MSSFHTSVPGKWILAGEHSVLRGCPALVFPLSSRRLELSYQQGKEDVLDLQLQGEHGGELRLLFWGVLERACELKKIRRAQLKGQVILKSSIPVGAGLGASAALCVAVVQWLSWMKLVKSEEQQDFARELENLFHGESSGVDIAVALSGQALHFERQGDRHTLQPSWQPKWYVSYSGKRGVTLECVKKVKALFEKNASLAAQLDQSMKEAVLKSEQALSLPQDQGFSILCEAIQKAAYCFEAWGLVEGAPSQHISMLKQAGASAVKPTGSGDGGYVLSLWKEEPPIELQKTFIPC